MSADGKTTAVAAKMSARYNFLLLFFKKILNQNELIVYLNKVYIIIKKTLR